MRDTATSPKATAPQETHAYDLAEIQQMLSVMPDPAATIFAVAAFTGLRRSELQGLRWEDYVNGKIRVSRAIWEGHVNDPKTGRSKGAGSTDKTGRTTVGISPYSLWQSCDWADVREHERKPYLPEQRTRAADSAFSETMRGLRQSANRPRRCRA